MAAPTKPKSTVKPAGIPGYGALAPVTESAPAVGPSSPEALAKAKAEGETIATANRYDVAPFSNAQVRTATGATRQVGTTTRPTATTNYANDLETGKTVADTQKAIAGAPGEAGTASIRSTAAPVRKPTKKAPVKRGNPVKPTEAATNPTETIVEETQAAGTTTTDTTTNAAGTSSTGSTGFLSTLFSGGSLPIILLGAGAGVFIWYQTKGKKGGKK